VNKTCRFLASVCLCSLLPATAPALAGDDAGVDWPGWRGPAHDGVSTETGWSPVSRDEPLWTKHIGFGHSSFAVANGRLYAMGYDLERKLDVVYCLDPQTGEEQWTHTYPAEHWNEGHDGGTCTTPTVDGDTIYTSNREGKLFALRADTGSVLWSHEMQPELGVTPPRWGFSGSPVVVDDMIVMNVSKLAAYEKATGTLAWVTEKEYGNAYSTPIEFDFNGRPSMLVLNGLGLAVIDRADGSEITFHPWTRNPERAVYGSTPVVVGNRIFISASSGTGCVMLEPNEEDGLDVVWESRVMRTAYSGAILYEGHLYGFDASILKCIDLEGNEKWRERGIGLGAVALVGGRLLVIGAKGELIIAEANPEKYVELSREKVLDGGAFWSTPVLSHGLAFARNSLGDMVCRDYRATRESRHGPRLAGAGALPSAQVLLARHVEAIGDGDAVGGMTGVHLTGAGEQHGGGPIETCDAELTWVAGGPDTGAFVWRFSSGLDFGYTPKMGWRMSQSGPAVLEPDDIALIREVGDLQRVLTKAWGYASLETVESRVFDDRPCYVVAAELEGGAKRTLYFEVESGLLAGQEGEDVPLWIFDDYRSVGAVKVPMEWSFFDAESGSMTLAKFSEASADAPAAASLQPPPLITMMTRSPEEKEAANEALRAKHGDLVGKYVLASGSMAGTPITIDIGDGGIRLAFGPQPPGFLSEPDEEHRLFLMAQPQIYIAATPRAGGDGHDIVLWAYGNEFGRIERAEEE
jgi:outer membrane protein assembly factor BamB